MVLVLLFPYLSTNSKQTPTPTSLKRLHHRLYFNVCSHKDGAWLKSKNYLSFDSNSPIFLFFQDTQKSLSSCEADGEESVNASASSVSLCEDSGK